MSNYNKEMAAKMIADLVQDIEERCRLPHGNLNGLKNASGDSLKALLAAILVLEEVS